jgi:hypothetical protein
MDPQRSASLISTADINVNGKTSWRMFEEKEPCSPPEKGPEI